MASLMENLVDVLEKESIEYNKLLELSMRKTPVIVSADLEQLQNITDEEQIVLGRINRLEQKREEVVKDIANVINVDVRKVKLVDFIRMLESRPAEQEKLAKAHDALKDVVGQMKRVNEQNGELLKQSMEMIEFDMNVLKTMKAAPETANYNKGAYNAGNLMGVGRGGFDAKQ